MGTARLRVTASTSAQADSASTGAWLPALERRRVAEPETAHAHSWLTTEGRTLYGRRDQTTYWLWSPGVATFSFSSHGPVAYDCVDEESAQQLWRRSALPLALEARGLPLLHASGVAANGSCVVICGRSTAGKSTVATAAARVGLGVIADDAIALGVSQQSVEALTLPFELRPRGDVVAPPVAGSGGESIRLSHLVFLEPDAAAPSTSLEKLTPSEAFAAVMPHVYCFSLEDSKERLVDEYAAVVERTPCVRLRYRQEPSSLPSMLSMIGALVVDETI